MLAGTLFAGFEASLTIIGASVGDATGKVRVVDLFDLIEGIMEAVPEDGRKAQAMRKTIMQELGGRAARRALSVDVGGLLRARAGGSSVRRQLAWKPDAQERWLRSEAGKRLACPA